MKYETGEVSIEEFVGLKPEMYLFLVAGSSDHILYMEYISYSEYKNVLLNNKCQRHSMNRIIRNLRNQQNFFIMF